MSGWNNNNADQTVKKSSDNSQFKDEENISDFTGKFQSIGISGWDNNDTEFDRKMRANIQKAKDDGNKSETTGTGGSSAPRESTAWYITELPKRPKTNARIPWKLSKKEKREYRRTLIPVAPVMAQDMNQYANYEANKQLEQPGGSSEATAGGQSTAASAHSTADSQYRR